MSHHDEYSNIYLTDKKAQEIENYIYKEKDSNNFGPSVPREFNGKYTRHKIVCNIFKITKIRYVPLLNAILNKTKNSIL